ncbi:MAG: response regulator [Leptothrix sp. (in: b-proteobacteria)]
MSIRVVLADDHRMLREALRDLLSRIDGIEVVGEAGCARGALEQAHVQQPDVLVLDIALPDMSGMALATRVRQELPRTGIVALSGYADKRFVTEMLRCGAQAYVTKSAAGSELIRAIRAVADGLSYLCPEVAGALVSEVRSREAEGGELPRLGRRELEVLRLVAAGARSQAIAEQMHISVATVEVHRRNIMRKLELRTIAELTRYAVREGIILA